MTLRRHPALAPLSRDHHLALQLAAGLRTDGSAHLRARLPRDPRALAAHVRQVFASELEPHFVAEERHVMVAVDGLDARVDTLCADLRRDHDAMRALVRELDDAADDAAITALLDRFGRRLEQHVRAEERILFARAQELLGDPALARLAPHLERRLLVAEDVGSDVSRPSEHHA